ncbi:DUF2092 domain-containing protein [Novosphingobium sp. PhB165]|uniref:DUF2092 domain-containing protein n=1 Tax=Novosphingobium sp. PhB165 TaxID=2485105 RepID=UPI001052B76B|nr:DUF2092 domain-containing protein [Novosphingobium sp. PhB165]
MLGTAAGASFPAQAQSAASSAASADASAPIDPAAMAAVDKMSAALQALSSFHVRSDVTTEVVLVTGQKIQFGGTVDTFVRRPNAFRIIVAADTRSREMYYDGKTFTIFAPKLGYYADFAAPSTIGLTVDKAQTQFDIEIPLADLFTWSTDQKIRSRIQEAMIVRPEQVGGKQCMHYAFRQEHVDWQLWIDQGSQGLPCKIVITNKDDPTMPQYTALLTWDLTPLSPSENFTFVPPSGANRINIADVSKMTPAKGEGQ